MPVRHVDVKHVGIGLDPRHVVAKPQQIGRPQLDFGQQPILGEPVEPACFRLDSSISSRKAASAALNSRT